MTGVVERIAQNPWNDEAAERGENMKLARATRLISVILAVGVAFSCGTEKAPTAPPPPAVNPSLLGNTLGTVTGLVGTLLKCSPQPFDTDSARIGRDGGILTMGNNALVIPPGALSSTIWIKGTALRDTVNSVRFSPEGLRFAKPAALVMSYSNCSLLGGLLTPKRIAYTTDNLRVLQWLPTYDNILSRTVTGRLDHFSRYAVGW
jgi:hypothetical protein